MAQRTSKLAGALSRSPNADRKVSAPGAADQNGQVSIPRNPNTPPTPQLERLSPGVYRNAKGDLTDMRGKVLQRPAPQPQQTDWQSIVNRYQPMQRPGENQYPQNISPETMDAMNRALEAARQAQPPPNVPIQPWEQMQNAGPRPAMQTPYDRWRFANQQNNPPFQQQPNQINWQEPMITREQMDQFLRSSGWNNNGGNNNPGQSAPQQQSVGMQNYQRLIKNM